MSVFVTFEKGIRKGMRWRVLQVKVIETFLEPLKWVKEQDKDGNYKARSRVMRVYSA